MVEKASAVGEQNLTECGVCFTGVVNIYRIIICQYLQLPKCYKFAHLAKRVGMLPRSNTHFGRLRTALQLTELHPVSVLSPLLASLPSSSLPPRADPITQLGGAAVPLAPRCPAGMPARAATLLHGSPHKHDYSPLEPPCIKAV